VSAGAPSTRASQLRRLLALFPRRRRVQFALVLALTLVGAVAELVSIGAVVPFLQVIAAPAAVERLPGVGWAMRQLGAASGAELLWPAAALMIGAAVASAAARIVLIWVSSRYIFGLTYDLSVTVYDRVIRQPYPLYIRRNSADVLSGLEKVQYVGGYLFNPLMTALSSAIIAAGIVGLLVAIDPFVALLTGGSVALLYGATALATRSLLLGIGHTQTRLATRRIKFTQETLGSFREIILDRSHGAFVWEYQQLDARIRRLAAVTNFISLSPRYLVEGAGIVLIAGLALWFAGRPGGVVAAIPVLGALALGAQRLLPLAQNINVAFVQYASMAGMVGDVLALAEGPVAERTRPAAEAAPFAREVRLDAVSFAYDEGRPALDAVSLAIPKGARIGIIGRTGSGKSTLLDVLMGLLAPTAGAVRVDGEALAGTRVDWWQAQVAHVPQAIFLLDDTIAANIAFAAPGEAIDMARVEDAAARANVAEFVAHLPQGYATTVGERGVRLSGGQRQRLGIARALYKRASVLILDEATSALDDATERSVMAAIDRLDPDLTILMIAHRLSTVARCDRVVRLEGGRIVAEGTFDAVVGREAAGVD
jgi:ATP-binding cassette, subfamily B, bacterial PglK